MSFKRNTRPENIPSGWAGKMLDSVGIERDRVRNSHGHLSLFRFPLFFKLKIARYHTGGGARMERKNKSLYCYEIFALGAELPLLRT